MKSSNDIHAAAKRFVTRYIRGRKPRRLHTTNQKMSIENIYNCPQVTDHKPKGIWYGIADSWIDWCLGESFGGIHNYIYEVVVDESRILTIDNIFDFEKFEDEHHDIPEWKKQLREMEGFPEFDLSFPRMYGRTRYFDSMNYGKVAESFGGIEITPYQWEKRLESMWYYGWDCASGCIWNPDAVKDLRLFAYYDPRTDEFIKTSLQQDKIKV